MSQHLSILNNSSKLNAFFLNNGYAISSNNTQVNDYIIEVRVKKRIKHLFDSDISDISQEKKNNKKNKLTDMYYRVMGKLEKRSELCKEIYSNMYEYTFSDVLHVLKIR